MVNVFLEIQRLKTTLENRGLDYETVTAIVQKAEREIADSLKNQMDDAMESAIQSGVQKDSAEFINELRPRPDAFILETNSGNTDFSTPPYPMLDRLLAGGAKPIKDGSGVYKVIPVGAKNKPKPDILSNIFDTQKAVAAERYKQARSQYNKIVPQGSKGVNFRTATSKQNRNTQWVHPGEQKDFTEDLQSINDMLHESHDSIVMSIIRSYEESF
jgi:hypothetical protein